MYRVTLYAIVSVWSLLIKDRKLIYCCIVVELYKVIKIYNLGGDRMKNKKLIFSISLIFILIVCVYIIIMSRPQDNITLMEKMISKQIKTKKTVMVYNAIVVDDYELASYIIEDAKGYEKCGYVHFRINKDGKYELIDIIDADKTIKKAPDITVYKFSQLKVGNAILPYTETFVISNNPKLAKIERIIENGETQIKEITTNPSISFFEDLDGDIKAKYNFYDEYGDIIK